MQEFFKAASPSRVKTGGWDELCCYTALNLQIFRDLENVLRERLNRSHATAGSRTLNSLRFIPCRQVFIISGDLSRTNTINVIACTQIKCIHDRVLTSTDFYDFSFPNAIDKTKATYPDKMVIPQNFASLKFNMATRLSGGKKEVAMKNLTAINVAIYTGAISNLSLAVFSCSTVIALSLF